jgi:hypothetical protein
VRLRAGSDESPLVPTSHEHFKSPLLESPPS